MHRSSSSSSRYRIPAHGMHVMGCTQRRRTVRMAMSIVQHAFRYLNHVSHLTSHVRIRYKETQALPRQHVKTGHNPGSDRSMDPRHVQAGSRLLRFKLKRTQPQSSPLMSCLREGTSTHVFASLSMCTITQPSTGQRASRASSIHQGHWIESTTEERERAEPNRAEPDNVRSEAFSTRSTDPPQKSEQLSGPLRPPHAHCTTPYYTSK